MGSFLFCLYSIVHLQFLWVFYAVWRWDELGKETRPKGPKWVFCAKWGAIIVAFFGFDLIGILPFAVKHEAILGMTPWFLIKSGVLVFLFTHPEPRT